MLLGTLTWLRSRTRELKNEHGATAIEYGLLAALIAAAIILTVAALGGTLADVFDFIEGEIADVL